MYNNTALFYYTFSFFDLIWLCLEHLATMFAKCYFVNRKHYAGVAISMKAACKQTQSGIFSVYHCELLNISCKFTVR